MFRGLLRCVRITTTHQTVALVSSSRHLKSRSLQADDPFGEKASWEDPEGLITPWRDINQEAFAAAASSETVQGAHFGPLWSRFSTIGKLSIKAAGQQESGQDVPTTEQLHLAELQRKQAALQKNYQTYEEFAAAELHCADNSNSGNRESEGGLTAEEEERAVENVVLGHDPISGHRMVQRGEFAAEGGATSPITRGRTVEPTKGQQEASSTTRPAEDEEESSPPLPGFMMTSPSPSLDEVDMAVAPPVPAAAAATEEDEEAFPLLDPKQWSNDLVIDWLCAFSPEAMDDSMIEAYRMVRVDGDMLLNKVTPNVMFKKMRRWHLKRVAMVAKGTPMTLEEQRAETDVSSLLVQETIYLCYPYCR